MSPVSLFENSHRTRRFDRLLPIDAGSDPLSWLEWRQLRGAVRGKEGEGEGEGVAGMSGVVGHTGGRTHSQVSDTSRPIDDGIVPSKAFKLSALRRTHQNRSEQVRPTLGTDPLPRGRAHRCCSADRLVMLSGIVPPRLLLPSELDGRKGVWGGGGSGSGRVVVKKRMHVAPWGALPRAHAQQSQTRQGSDRVRQAAAETGPGEATGGGRAGRGGLLNTPGPARRRTSAGGGGAVRGHAQVHDRAGRVALHPVEGAVLRGGAWRGWGEGGGGRRVRCTH